MNNLSIYVLDNSLLMRRLQRRHSRHHRTEWVREIYLKRDEFGEFHHGYLSMNKETFVYILSTIRPYLTKYSNFRKTVSPEERLFNC